MPYNPEKHHRRSIRLREYDYAQAGAYFVTICTHDRLCLFGNIAHGIMKLNPFGEIVFSCWDEIPRHFDNVELDAFVIMPNHVHGSVLITGDPMTSVGATQQRKTTLPSETPIALTTAFAKDQNKQKQWQAFLMKNRMEPARTGFVRVVATIRELLLPPAAALVQQQKFKKVWPAGGSWRKEDGTV